MKTHEQDPLIKGGGASPACPSTLLTKYLEDMFENRCVPFWVYSAPPQCACFWFHLSPSKCFDVYVLIMYRPVDVRYSIWGVPTFSGSCGPQVVDSPQDEPQGLLLFPRNAQHLHGRLQLGELLQGSLLVLRLEEIRSDQIKIQWSRTGRWNVAAASSYFQISILSLHVIQGCR